MMLCFEINVIFSERTRFWVRYYILILNLTFRYLLVQSEKVKMNTVELSFIWGSFIIFKMHFSVLNIIYLFLPKLYFLKFQIVFALSSFWNYVFIHRFQLPIFFFHSKFLMKQKLLDKFKQSNICKSSSRVYRVFGV